MSALDPREPASLEGDAAIPDAVLDELRSAFAGGALTGPMARRRLGELDESLLQLGVDVPPAPLGHDHSPVSPAAAPPPVGRSDEREPAAGTGPSRAPSRAAKPSRRERRRAERAARAGATAPSDPSRAPDDGGREGVRVVPAASPPPEAPGRAATPPAGAGPPPSGSPPVVSPPRTIVIGDDDLPDAVYLDANAEGRLEERYGAEVAGGTGAIVLGSELEASGAFDAVALPSRSMDPRVRARRIAVKRAATRKRLIWAGAALAVVLLLVAALAVFASSLFAVRAGDVAITGAVYTDPAQLQAIVDDAVGEPTLTVDTLRLERRLEQLPWIERASVDADFPHHLEIDIRERVPLAAFAGTDGRHRVIDRDGRVLAVLDNQPLDYMPLTGAAPDVEPGALAGQPFADAARLVSALPADIRRITTSVSVDATTGDLGMLLQPAVEVRLGSFAGIDAKLARMLQFMRKDGGIADCVRLDVSTGEVSCLRS